jgi:hypothetical protein
VDEEFGHRRLILTHQGGSVCEAAGMVH